MPYEQAVSNHPDFSFMRKEKAFFWESGYTGWTAFLLHKKKNQEFNFK